MFTSNNISASNRVAVRHSQSSLHFGVKRKYEEAASSLSITQLLQRQKETNDAFITWRTAVDEAGERPSTTEKSRLVNLHRTFLLLVETALQPLGASYRRVNAHDNFVPLSPDIKEGKARKTQGEFGFKYKGVQYKAIDSDSKDIVSVNDMTKATVRGQQFQNRGQSSRFQNNDYETGLASQASDPVFKYLASKVSKEEEAPPQPAPTTEVPNLTPATVSTALPATTKDTALQTPAAADHSVRESKKQKVAADATQASSTGETEPPQKVKFSLQVKKKAQPQLAKRNALGF